MPGIRLKYRTMVEMPERARVTGAAEETAEFFLRHDHCTSANLSHPPDFSHRTESPSRTSAWLTSTLPWSEEKQTLASDFWLELPGAGSDHHCSAAVMAIAGHGRFSRSQRQSASPAKLGLSLPAAVA